MSSLKSIRKRRRFETLFWALGLAVVLGACFTFTFGVMAEETQFEATPAHADFHEVTTGEIESALNSLHVAPRLLLTDEKIAEVRSKIDSDACWSGYYSALAKLADDKAKLEPVKRVLTGVRLLSVSREALARIFDWSFMYRYTGDKRYAERVEKEALAIADFEDWNPSHFLDVAEMTTAMAIGYDSCKDAFSDEAKAKIREAIYTKGILESLKVKGWWKRNTANWNQVCWCGSLYGSLAIVDDVDEEQRKNVVLLIRDSVNGVTWSMSSYEPDGNYTEGPGYWGYGTGFNILMVGALDSALGTDFGRSDSVGFLKSIVYYEHVFGTSGNAFNYPDSGGGRMFEASAFWYASKLKQPEIVWNEMNAILTAEQVAEGKGKKGDRAFRSLVRDRLAVNALLWGAPASEIQPPKQLGYVGVGNGKCCVALFRTAWDANAAYLGIKCGVPNTPHGHLDEGSFVYDDCGVRWIVELGPEDYHSIESRGMNLWNMGQGSDRWKLLRYNNFGHSVPTINGELQIVNGRTSFTETKIGEAGEESYATIDLTPVYKNDVAKASRKATLFPDGSLVIEDSFEALADKEATVERRFLTPAKVEEHDSVFRLLLSNPIDSEITLTKTLETKTDRSIEIERFVYPCETQEEYDSKNPGVSVILEKSKLAPGEKAVFTTRFSPASVD